MLAALTSNSCQLSVSNKTNSDNNVATKMILREVNDTAKLIYNDKIVRYVAFGVFLASVFFASVINSLAGFCIFANYILGIVVCWAVLKYKTATSAVFQRLAIFYKGHILPQKNVAKKCTVCSNKNCDRHESQFIKQPWKGLVISRKLNDAIQQFFNRIIDTFITSWYRNFTDDTTYLNELKQSLRFASASAANKITEIKTGKTIVKKLIPCFIKHIDDHQLIEQFAKVNNKHFNDVAVEYLGKKIHIAATNRKNEVEYLRKLTELIIKEILPGDYLKCKNYSVLIREILSVWVLLPLMDVIADPNILNYLIIICVNYKSSKINQSELSNIEKVEFLTDFVNKEMKNSSLTVDLKTVIKTPELLYAIMQYLKKEGVVHLLQFCMDVEEFNNKLLTPDLSKRQLEDLHIEALNLYKVYLDKNSVEFIGCNEEIVENLDVLLSQGVYNVHKLRTSEPLFQAFDFAWTTLENDWLPSFYHSNEFYVYMCGPKVTSAYSKSSSKGPRKQLESNQGTVSKISSGFGKIKGALKPNQPIEGSVFAHESPIIDSEVPNFVEDVISPDCSKLFRDLSAWKVTIPDIDLHHSGSSKLYHIFVINIQRMDTALESEIKNWNVRRKDVDFYTLKAKLIEFHGENEITDTVLPARRNNNPAEYRRKMYEEFLKKLLQKPSLRGSDLLHSFLTTEHDFTLLVTSTVPIGDLGNIYQSVAHKLRKEKGQHLDSFMSTFLTSTGKIKPSKFDWAEQVEESETSEISHKKYTPKTLNNKIFNDNFGVEYKKVDDSSSSTFNPNGITESLFYLLKNVFKVRDPILKLYAAFCSVAQNAFESFSMSLIEKKIKTALSHSNLAFLIGQLEYVIFEKHSSPTKEELEERKMKAFDDLNRIVPNYLTILLGENFKSGLSSLLTVLQNPLYNKQLAYSFLDIIVAEIFPNFDKED